MLIPYDAIAGVTGCDTMVDDEVPSSEASSVAEYCISCKVDSLCACLRPIESKQPINNCSN